MRTSQDYLYVFHLKNNRNLESLCHILVRKEYPIHIGI